MREHNAWLRGKQRVQLLLRLRLQTCKQARGQPQI